MPPLVGITSSPIHHRSAVLAVDRALTTLDRAYVDAVTGAGAAVVVLPAQPSDNAAATIAALDALVLSGGGDVAPERYGAERHPAVGGVDHDRDEWEVALIIEARRQSLPVLAICRGLQILNVALGGTLIQHLPDAVGSPHLVPDRFAAVAHPVQITPGTCLAKLLDTDVVDVNTLHHQAIEVPADGLLVSARDEHGIVEAVELPDEPVVGVQWHPELLAHVAPHARLFEWLVAQTTPAGVSRR